MTCVIAVALLLATSGCSGLLLSAPPIPTSDEVEGSWTAEEPDGQTSTLDFDANGTFHGDFPIELLRRLSSDPSNFNWTKRFNGDGTWKIGDERRGTPQKVEVIVTTSTGIRIRSWFWMEGDIGSREIYQVIGGGDSDELLVFSKD
jgi:hypothetical protein